MSSSLEILLSTVFCLLIKTRKTFLILLQWFGHKCYFLIPKFSISLPVLSVLFCFSDAMIRHRDQKQPWKENIFSDFRLQPVTEGSWGRCRQEPVRKRNTGLPIWLA